MTAVGTARTVIVAPRSVRAGARAALTVAPPVLVVLGYELFARSAASPYFPTVAQIAEAFVQTWGGEGFGKHVVPTLSNYALGWTTGLLLGVVVGVLVGRVRTIDRLLRPIVAFALTLPGVALLPVFLMVFGVNSSMQRALIATSVFFLTVVNTSAGVRATEHTLHDMADVYRIGGPRRLFLLTLPGAAPHIIAAARVSLSLALLVAIVSEMVGASRGIGAVTLLAQQEFVYTRMWAGIVLLSLLGICVNLLFALFERTVPVRLGLLAPTTQAGRAS
ncbi:MAG TPA: ABC transporter permease subunit [Arachnia sp.]|mgnify:CR=1 FL=1|nr:ABC transporter permease subunit [Arachnia sp.]HMT87059.1 ABC transporter permease subunit [Arachnia sp.]